MYCTCAVHLIHLFKWVDTGWFKISIISQFQTCMSTIQNVAGHGGHT